MGATRATTANEPGSEASGSGKGLSRAPAAIVSGALGLVLLLLAGPRLVGEIGVIGARGTVLAAFAQEGSGGNPPPTLTEMTQAATRIAAVGPMTGDARLLADRGTLLLRLAATSVDPAARRRHLDDAEAAIVEALALAPANTNAWAQLAYVRSERGNRPGAAEALRLSLLTGAVAPQLMPSRLRLGLYLLPDGGTELHHLLERQVRLLWIIESETIVAMSAEPDLQPFIQNALAGISDAEIQSFIHRNRIPERSPSTP